MRAKKTEQVLFRTRPCSSCACSGGRRRRGDERIKEPLQLHLAFSLGDLAEPSRILSRMCWGAVDITSRQGERTASPSALRYLNCQRVGHPAWGCTGCNLQPSCTNSFSRLESKIMILVEVVPGLKTNQRNELGSKMMILPEVVCWKISPRNTCFHSAETVKIRNQARKIDYGFIAYERGCAGWSAPWRNDGPARRERSPTAQSNETQFYWWQRADRPPR